MSLADEERCSVVSARLGEPMPGTAPLARAWLVLEQPGPYGRVALTESHLPAAVGAALSRAAEGTRTSVLLARTTGRHADDHEETVRAHMCHTALFEEGKAEGFIPYRVGPHAMQRIVDPDSAFFKLVSRLKDAVDPAGILDPGRYAPTRRPEHSPDPPEGVSYAALSRASGAALR